MIKDAWVDTRWYMRYTHHCILIVDCITHWVAVLMQPSGELGCSSSSGSSKQRVLTAESASSPLSFMILCLFTFSWVAFQLCLKIYCPYHTQSPIIDPLTVDFKSSLVFLNTKHWIVSLVCFLHLIVLYFPVFSNLLSFPVPIQAWVKVQSCSRAMERHVSDFAHNKLYHHSKCLCYSKVHLV